MAKRKTELTPQERFDSYAKAFLGGRPKYMNYGAEMQSMGGTMIPQPTLTAMYLNNGYARLICDKVAEEMTRAGFNMKEMDDDTKQKIQARLEELEFVKRLNEGIKWRRAFGGSLILMGVDDGKLLRDELNEDAVQDITFFRVYDCYEVTVSKRYDDPAHEKFGLPELYLISPKNSNGITSFEAHETRVLIFDGESVPNDTRAANNGWGASVLQTCFTQLVELNSTHKWAGLLLERMQQAVHSIPNLSEQIDDADGEAKVTKRLFIVDAVRSALNTIAIDAQETYEVKSMSLAGVTDIIDRKAEALSACSEIPMFVLMGRSVGGLNSTGEANRDAWYAKVGAMQNNELRKPVDRVISLLMRGFTNGDTDGGDYTLEFNPLSTLSDKEQSEVDNKNANTEKIKMETYKGYVEMSVMDQEEVREAISEEFELEGPPPEPEEEEAPAPITLNPGQKLVAPEPGQSNPALAPKNPKAKPSTVGKVKK